MNTLKSDSSRAPGGMAAAPRRTFGGRFALIAAGLGAPFTAGVAQDDGAGSRGVEEIIVTANKREENIRDVAAAVSAFSGDELTAMGAQSLADYVARIPGVVFNDYQPGVSEVVIRGISSTTYHEQGQTVAGYYINEVPLSEPGWPIVIPDIDTFDLRRVEVLRGPQGTLFGSASLGGLVNYVAREADPTRLDMAFETSVGSTDNSGEANYAVKGMLNAPLAEDTFGIRAVVLQRYDAGYIDNVNTGVGDANDLRTTGARLAALYEPSDRTKLSWMTMYQESALDDQTYVIVPTLTRDTFVPEPHDTELLVNSLRLDQALGELDLTLLGAYSEKESRIVFDQTATGYLQATPTETVGNAEAEIATFEARLAWQGERFGWLVGAMYHDSSKKSADDVLQDGAQDFVDANPGDFGGFPGSLLAPNDRLSSYQIDQENEETAVFGELNYMLTDALKLTLGGRFFDTTTDSTVTRPPSATFPGVFDADGSSFNEGADETGFTPKLSLAFKPNDAFLLYGLYSEGFRVGGANPNPPGATGAGAAPSYDSDSVMNYELGVRSTLADRRLQLDATYFHVDWDDIQVRLFTPAPLFLAYVTNAGSADIDGLELSAAWVANSVLDLSANVTWLDARLAEFLPDTFAAGGGYEAGTTLPGASEWTANASATLGFGGRLDPRVNVSYHYVSKAPVAFNSVTERGGFSLVDVRGTFALTDAVELAVYADNVFDEYGVMNAPFADFFPQPLGSVTRPRTYGVRLNWNLR